MNKSPWHKSQFSNSKLNHIRSVNYMAPPTSYPMSLPQVLMANKVPSMSSSSVSSTKHHLTSSSSSSSSSSTVTAASTTGFPVFVFPTSLNFYVDDSHSHKQCLSIYNPYDFSVKFKVLSTAPNKYYVQEPEGTILPRCYVDLVVRIDDLSSINQTDRFRVVMTQQGSHGTSGTRDITATLFSTKPPSHMVADSSDSGKSFHEANSYASGHSLTQSQIFNNESQLSQSSHTSFTSSSGGTNFSNPRSPNYFLIMVSVAAIVVLMMPNSEEDTKSSLFAFLPIPGVQLKLCAAYVLGCVTKPLLWP